MAVDRQLLESLAGWRDASVVILGVGNALRADDGAGPLVCEALPAGLPAKVINAGTTPENYIQPILRAAPDALWVIDAVDVGTHPGQISVLDPDQVRMFGGGTHAPSLRLVLDLLRHERAFDICLIGIKADRTALGEGVSPAVQVAIETLVETLTGVFCAPRDQGIGVT